MLCTILTLALASCTFAGASVQTPTATSCSRTQKVKVDDVSITNAKIGQTTTVNFTLINTESLGSNPTLQVTIYKENGKKLGCYNNIGSCAYKLCGGTTNAEIGLAQLWKNKCPVPAITVQESIPAQLNRLIEVFIGNAPTTVSIELKVTNGGTTVGCQSFKVKILKA